MSLGPSLCRSTPNAQRFVGMIGPGSSNANIPHGFTCSITKEIMMHPVVAADGHSYERSAICNWLAKTQRNTSPATGEVLVNKILRPNFALRQAIQEWKSNNGSPLDKRIAYELEDASKVIPGTENNMLLRDTVRSIFAEVERCASLESGIKKEWENCSWYRTL